MAVLTTSGRTALAIALQSSPLYLAWGSGSAAWDTTPIAEPVSATGLVAELGRRVATTVQYVAADPNGSIIVPTGTFSPSGTPTNSLYLTFAFDYADASASVVREIGVFTGTVLQSGLPAGQTYFTPAQLSSPGILYSLQYLAAIVRSANTRQSFEFVLTL